VTTPGSDAAIGILKQASALSAAEISKLGAATGMATGYVGLRSSWIEARNAGIEAARTAGLGASLEGITSRASGAILAAAVAAAAARHRDPDRVRDAWRAYQASGPVWYGGERHREARQLRKVLRISLGVGTERNIRLAIDGTVAAAIAALTWTLAREKGGYTVQHRDLLIKPWTAVAAAPK
jgi:hypothetical protein